MSAMSATRIKSSIFINTPAAMTTETVVIPPQTSVFGAEMFQRRALDRQVINCSLMENHQTQVEPSGALTDVFSSDHLYQPAGGGRGMFKIKILDTLKKFLSSCMQLSHHDDDDDDECAHFMAWLRCKPLQQRYISDLS